MNCFFSEYPYLSVKVKVASQKFEGQDLDEEFSLALGGNLAKIEATSPLAASYAKVQLLAGLQSKSLGDVVGNNRPQFSIRPLWLDSLDNVLPDTLIELGFNTLIVRSDQIDKTLVHELQNSHIKLAVLCSCLEQCKQPCDYIVWQQGSLGYAGTKKDPTPYEQALYELQRVQLESSKPVFYYTKPKCPFLHKLAVNAAGAIIAFDAYVDAELSSVFAEIAGLAIQGQMPLLPVISLPQIKLADDLLFTDVPVAELESVLGRQKGDRFIGAACKTGTLSSPQQLSQMPLWVVGQRMWRAQSVLSLVEAWLARYHPEWAKVLSDKIFQLVHALFCCRESGNIEQGVKVLLELANTLSGHKAAMRFQKSTKSQEALSLVLFELQWAFKVFFEQVCTKAMLKTPLPLQNFAPIAFQGVYKKS